MSFQLPQNVPSFSSPQRPLEDSYWQANRDNRSNRLPGYGLSPSSGIPNKLNSFFDTDRRLPMYKDKPYFAPRRTGPRSRRRKALYSGLCLFVLAVLWYCWPVARAWKDSRLDSMAGEDLWKWMQTLEGRDSIDGNWGHKSPIDWAERREKVRDAFIVSWDGYEKHAWGMSGSCLSFWDRLVEFSGNMIH